jgi:hypothetical protein
MLEDDFPLLHLKVIDAKNNRSAKVIRALNKKISGDC